MEEWKDVVGFEGAYQVSNYGNLRSIDRISKGKRYSGKLLSKSQERSGYIVDILSFDGIRKTVRRHRLVAEAFIPNPDGKPEINHLDGNKINNHVDNLEWATHRENTDHAWVTGLTPSPPKAKERSVLQFYEGQKIAEYKSIDIAAIINRISAEDICKCCKGKRKNAGRFFWRYKEEDYGS